MDFQTLTGSLRTVFLSVCFALCGVTNFADFAYSVESPYLGMTVGRGYDYYNREAVRGDCLLDPSAKTIDSYQGIEDAMESNMTQTVISSHDELMKELEMSNHATIRSLFFSADPKFKVFHKFKNSERSLTFLYSLKIATREETLHSLSRSDLSPDALRLLTLRDYEGFTRLCGTHYVRSTTYGGEFSQVYEIDEKDQEKLRDFSASLRGEYKLTENTSKIKELFIRNRQSRFIKKETFQTGGGVHLSDLDIENYQDRTKEWVESIRQSRGQAYKVELADWQTILIDYQNPYFAENREGILQGAYKMVRDNKVNINKISYALFLNQKLNKLSEEQVLDLKENKQNIESQQVRLMRFGRACFLDNKACHFEEKAIELDFDLISEKMPQHQKNIDLKPILGILGTISLIILAL